MIDRNIAAAIVFIVAATAFASDPAPNALRIPANQYTGRKLELRPCGLAASTPFKWRVAVSGRVLASGSATAGADGSAKIETELPPLKDGASAKAELLLSYGGAPELAAPLTLHSGNVFAEGAPAKMPDIGVWAPDGESDSKITRLLESQGLKPETINNLGSFKGDVLLVSGIDFDETPDAFGKMLALASGGAHVVVIPPVKGTISLKPATFSSLLISKGLPESAAWSRACAGDLDVLPATSKSAALSLGGADSPLELKFSNGAAKPESFGFCRLDAGKGRVTLLGWDLAGLSGSSPVPLLVLKGLFGEYETANKLKDR